MIIFYSALFTIFLNDVNGIKSDKISKEFMISQDKEAYCGPIRESLKTILSWGWIIERIGESDFASLYKKSKMASQASQVWMPAHIYIKL